VRPVLLALAAAVLCAGCGARRAAQRPPTTAPPPKPTFTGAVVSSNWSGYVVRRRAGGAGGFTQATGRWRMPRIRCSGGAGSSAAFWVGIGGFGHRSPSLEQLGASADCSPRGVASYHLWTEIVPAGARYLAMRLAPGDVVTASVSTKGRVVSFALENLSRGARYATSTRVGHALDTATAEWIAEAPSLCRTIETCQVIPLANYGLVLFSGISAAAGSTVGALGGRGWVATPVALVSSLGSKKYVSSTNSSGSVPRPPDAGGRSFAVEYRASLTGIVPQHPLAGAPLPPWVH
jgi:hypothetical protein